MNLFFLVTIIEICLKFITCIAKSFLFRIFLDLKCQVLYLRELINIILIINFLITLTINLYLY